MNVLIKILIVGILSCSVFCVRLSAQSFSKQASNNNSIVSNDGMNYRDSVYRRIIMEGGKSLDCHLSYRIGSSNILSSYADNAHELQRLETFLHTTLMDTLVHIKSISVTGYGSIDGSYMYNEKLSRDRSESFASYIRSRYPNLSSYPLHTLHVAEDWEGLKELLVSSTLPFKDRVLSIINNVPVFQGREEQLMALDGGAVYRELKRDYFPLLRRVKVKVDCDLQKIIEEHYKTKIASKDFAAVLEREKRRLTNPVNDSDNLEMLKAAEEIHLDSVAKPDTTIYFKDDLSKKEDMEAKSSLSIDSSPSEDLPSSVFKPILSVKTNLLSLAGYSTELKKKYFTPNVELEYFISPHWSVSGEWVYSVTETDGKDAHVWSPSSISLEPRYWFFASDDRHYWLYVGLYALTGEFDELLSDAQDDGHTGSYNEGGASLGVYLPFTSRLGMEFGARLGYRFLKGDSYYYSDSHYYYKSSYTKNELKPTGFRICVSYRFGK